MSSSPGQGLPKSESSADQGELIHVPAIGFYHVSEV